MSLPTPSNNNEAYLNAIANQNPELAPKDLPANNIEAYLKQIAENGGGGGMENPMTEIGDIIVGGENGNPLRLGKGTAGQVLKVNNDASGLEWGAASGGDAPTHLYAHNIIMQHPTVGTSVSLMLIKTTNSTISSISALNEALQSNKKYMASGCTSNKYPVFGFRKSSGGDLYILCFNTSDNSSDTEDPTSYTIFDNVITIW